jgi:hypothetical protein
VTAEDWAKRKRTSTDGVDLGARVSNVFTDGQIARLTRGREAGSQDCLRSKGMTAETKWNQQSGIYGKGRRLGTQCGVDSVGP